MRARPFASIVALAVLATAGCGGADDGQYSTTTVPVRGTVTYQGRPLTGGTVLFEPEGLGREAHGPIQPDGTFELSSYTQNDGAVVGSHRVAITDIADPSFPVKYRNSGSSGLTVEVVEGQTDYPITLQ